MTFQLTQNRFDFSIPFGKMERVFDSWSVWLMDKVFCLHDRKPNFIHLPSKMAYILEAEAVRFDSQIMFRRKCDSCGEHYFFQLEETKYDKCCVCDSCKPIESTTSKKSAIGGVRVVKGRTVAIKDYKIARRSKKNYKRVFQRDNFVCQYCMREGNTIDHINPVVAVGGNRMENLVCCCEECNKIACSLLFTGFYDKMNYILSKRKKK